MTGLIGTKFGMPVDSSGNGHRLNAISPSTPQGAGPSIPQVAGASKFHQKFEECLDLYRQTKLKYIIQKWNAQIDIIMPKLSRAKPGYPASYKYNYNFRSTGRIRPRFCTKLRLGKLQVPVESWLDICSNKR